MFVCNVKIISIKSELNYTHYSGVPASNNSISRERFYFSHFQEIMEKLEENHHRISTFSFKKICQIFHNINQHNLYFKIDSNFSFVPLCFLLTETIQHSPSFQVLRSYSTYLRS